MKTDYRGRLNIPIDSSDIKLYTKCGLHLVTGYERIVIGARGPYIELIESQIEQLHMEIPKDLEHRQFTDCYYVEYRTIDECNVKIYHQKKTVNYADYKIGFYYISPFDLKSDDIDDLVEPLNKNKNSRKFF